MVTAQSGASEEKALELGASTCLPEPVRARSLPARARAALTRINA